MPRGIGTQSQSSTSPTAVPTFNPEFLQSTLSLWMNYRDNANRHIAECQALLGQYHTTSANTSTLPMQQLVAPTRKRRTISKAARARMAAAAKARWMAKGKTGKSAGAAA